MGGAPFRLSLPVSSPSGRASRLSRPFGFGTGHSGLSRPFGFRTGRAGLQAGLGATALSVRMAARSYSCKQPPLGPREMACAASPEGPRKHVLASGPSPHASNGILHAAPRSEGVGGQNEEKGLQVSVTTPETGFPTRGRDRRSLRKSIGAGGERSNTGPLENPASQRKPPQTPAASTAAPAPTAPVFRRLSSRKQCSASMAANVTESKANVPARRSVEHPGLGPGSESAVVSAPPSLHHRLLISHCCISLGSVPPCPPWAGGVMRAPHPRGRCPGHFLLGTGEP